MDPAQENKRLRAHNSAMKKELDALRTEHEDFNEDPPRRRFHEALRPHQFAMRSLPEADIENQNLRRELIKPIRTALEI